MLKKKLDIHQTITDKIVAAVENGAGDFVMPWHRKEGRSQTTQCAHG